jgi:signal transduction histidine kinase
MFVALEADHITEFFNTMRVGPQSSATLVGEDKFVRSRSSYGPKGPGQDISGSQLWQRLEESPVGLYLQTSIVDDITRYYAYRKVPDLPLIVAIGLSVDDFQQVIEAARLNHYAIALLATLLIAVTVLFFYRQQELRKQIEANNTELQNQNAELERFNYTVSHDLKAPLVTIKGFLGLLQKDINAENQAAVTSDMSRISAAADEMGQLLNELLELSRIGRQINAPEVRDLSTLVHEAAERVAIQIKSQGIDLQIAADMPQVYGDPGRLLEVFQNLIDNSTKFMGEQKHPRIEIGAERDNGQVHCFVRDNGLGIAAEYHARVFDLFDRLDTKVDGTGVGLALVKRIVEVHGGRIWIESAGEGQGSSFHFTLPAVGE